METVKQTETKQKENIHLDSTWHVDLPNNLINLIKYSSAFEVYSVCK